MQQNTEIKHQHTSLLKAYPFLPTQARARMQKWVDETYGSDHDVTQLYLVRYGKDPHGHPSGNNPALDQEGAPAVTIPLWEVLQNNMPNSSLIGNDYSANRREYKIIDASDRGKKYDDAKSVLDPEKLYQTKGNVNFKVDLAKDIDQFYDVHKVDAPEWAKQRALTQLEVQHRTGQLSEDRYKGLKTVLETGKGGKIYTLSMGDNTTGGSGRFAFDFTLAGGMRIELDSGENFTYLPKEKQPYQAFDNALDAIESVRKHGRSRQEAREFVSKYRSLLGDPSMENPLAIKDMQNATPDAVFRRSHGNYLQLMHGKERDITHDPFGELTKASHDNDSQDAWDGIKSNTDISRATFEKWGGAGLLILSTLPIGLEGVGAVGQGVRNTLGRLAGEGSEEVAGAAETAATAAGRGGAEGVAEGAASEASKGAAMATGDGNLGVIDELEHINHPPSGVAPSNLSSLKAEVDPGKLALNKERGVYQLPGATTLGGDDREFVIHEKAAYQLAPGQGENRIIVDPRWPNHVTGGVPVKLDGKGGVEQFLQGSPGLKGGADDPPQPSTSSQARPSTSSNQGAQTLTQRDMESARNYRAEDGSRPYATGPNGTVSHWDLERFRQYWKDETYAWYFAGEDGSHPFRLASGRGDGAAYQRYMNNEARARTIMDEHSRPRFVKDNGSVDMDAYRDNEMKLQASNYWDYWGRRVYSAEFNGGMVNVDDYKARMNKFQQARKFTNEQGEQPFIKSNGDTDDARYRKTSAKELESIQRNTGNIRVEQPQAAASSEPAYMQDARKVLDDKGNPRFVRHDNSVDMRAYGQYRWDERYIFNDNYVRGNQKFMRGREPDVDGYREYKANETRARNFTDGLGERPFRRADNSGDVNRYLRFMGQHDQQFLKEQAALNYTEDGISYPFDRGGVPDTQGYEERMALETEARLYTDINGEHRFDRGSTVDIAGYQYYRDAEIEGRNLYGDGEDNPFILQDDIGSMDVDAYIAHRESSGNASKQP
ncbi:hypothetical protein GCM10010981_15460 [Dyella nitratireducens]|uniref:Dermonecrotic toxin N-terminal domain-containing protein n=1 Tax=Dyella nitratireducens TaxID=1849580 RepID=A0ABQ1FSK8_9GAMM|nr:hypothetical protein GCM10010981_15460 [Dyella nitratireducens]GLQ43389.1 hypothetical protein GCM10007902_32390 [Dyella nitratireducens]